MWVPLDPAPMSAGSLRFIPHSHTDDRRYRPTLFVTDDPLPGSEGEPPPDHTIDHPSSIGYNLEVGDLTIHHARTLHAASGNSTTSKRRALSIRYCGEDAVVRAFLKDIIEQRKNLRDRFNFEAKIQSID